MKKVIFSIFILTVIALLGCQRQNEVNSHEDENVGIDLSTDVYVDGVKVDSILLGPYTTNSQIILSEEFTLKNGVTLPKGTVISKIKADPYSFSYTVPEGYLITGVSDASGRVVATMAGTITCTCTKGSGCSPFIALGGTGTVEGCSLGRSCQACTMTRSARVGVLQTGDGRSEEAHSIDVINFSDGINFVLEQEELDKLKSPYSSILEIESIGSQVADFISAYQQDNLEKVRSGKGELPAGYILMHVNVFGRVFLLPVQESLVLSSSPLLNDLIPRNSANARVADSYSCKCLSGSSGCKLQTKNVLIGRAYWCEAGNCSSCQLKIN